VIETVYDPVDGLVKLGLASLLMVVLILLSRVRNLGIARELGVAVVRAVVQLMIVVLLIAAVFQSQNLLFVLLILAGMQGIAAATSAKRVSEVKDPLRITLPSIAAGTFVILVVMILLGVMPLQAEFLIPVGSMVTGAAMVTCSLSLDRFMREMATNRLRVETALSLGATWSEAVEPYTRQGIRASLIPSIDRLKTLGIVVLPGAMAGMIIGGVNPVWAAEYQLIIFFMIVGAELISAFVATLLAQQSVSLY